MRGALPLVRDFSSPEFFSPSFRLFPAPTNCPWVSEDAYKQRQTNEARYGSSLVMFYNKKWAYVYTVRQSMINLAFSRGYFGSWDVAVAIVERWTF